MPTPDLLTNLRDHLISEGVGRDPRVAGSTPPIWREPQDGAPAPGDKSGTEDGPDGTISLFRSGGIVLDSQEQRWHRNPTVDLVIRTPAPPAATALQEAIDLALLRAAGEPASSPAMNWQMGALTVISSQRWRDWQPLDFDENAYTVIGSWAFHLYLT